MNIGQIWCGQTQFGITDNVQGLKVWWWLIMCAKCVTGRNKHKNTPGKHAQKSTKTTNSHKDNQKWQLPGKHRKSNRDM